MLAARLAKGIFAKPGVYPAIVRFGNADPKINSDFKPDVRSLSFSVDLTRDGTASSCTDAARQDFSMQNTTTLPINDSPAFVATMKLLTASNPAAGLWSLPFKDKLRVFRTLALGGIAVAPENQTLSATALLEHRAVSSRTGRSREAFGDTGSGQSCASSAKDNPNGLQDELIRHLKEDGKMSGFDFGVQFLDTDRMTYWGKHRDANFWIENASVEWNETQAPFHTVGRLTLLRNSQLDARAPKRHNSTSPGTRHLRATPVGSINRARCPAEVASRKARMHVKSSCARV